MYTRAFGENQSVATSSGTAVHRVHPIGSHPLLLHFLGRMNFFGITRSCLGASPQTLLDHAQTLAILIQNILLSPAPLYRIAEWVRPIPPESLGLTATEKLSLNDDRVARSLDALVSPRARNLFFRLALHVIKQFDLNTARIHHDTTTVTFHGQYKGSVRDPLITQGYNKDHRPELKQLVFGLNVTADGAVPISHEVYSGNRTDDTLHPGNVERLRQLLNRMDFIYVADSKLCTNKNLGHLDRFGGKFVTVLPRTRGEDRQFRQALRQQGAGVAWKKLLEIENKRKKDGPPDVYYTTAAAPGATAEGYRIVWVRSSQKMALDAQARETALAKAKVELHALNARLNRGKLRKRSGIKQAFKAILRRYAVEPWLEVRIAAQVQIQTKHVRRGRPGPGAEVREIRRYVYRLEVVLRQEALRRESRTDGVFPLVTNLHPSTTSKKEVVLIYKYQPYVEKRHSLFKSELEVAPIYLKKPGRAVGLIHAVFLALTLDALIERTIRQGMKRHRLEALPILPEGRFTKTPTTARVLEMFSDVCWYEFERSGETVTFPIKLSPLQKQLLLLLDMDPTTYA